MTVDEIKREMMEEFSFTDEVIQQAFDTIYFVGIFQNLAWRKNEGILLEDITVDYDLIRYLIQALLIKTTNKNTQSRYEIYLLNNNGEKIFQELLRLKKNENIQRFEEFKREFEINDLKSLKLIRFNFEKKIETIDIKDSYRILFSNLRKGERLKEIFYEKITLLKNLLKNYDTIIDITKFQSNKILGKREFILYEEFYQFLLDYTKDFSKNYKKILNELNTKIAFYDELIKSIEHPNLRNNIQNDFANYLNKYRTIIKRFSQKKITTSYNSSKEPCFKIINEEQFKYSLNELKKEEIKRITTPIIDDLLAEVEPSEETDEQFAEPKSKVNLPTKVKIPKEQIISSENLNILLGNNSEANRVYWTPGKLNNGHLVIIGGSGAGKTETIRCIASELDKQGYPVLMIDFHGDMVCTNCNIITYEIKEGADTYFNPFELHVEFKDITPIRAIDDFIDAIKINFPNIGIVQRDTLREILKEAYEENNITLDKKTWTNELKFDYIEEKIKSSNIRPYLNSIVDYELFKGKDKISIKNILKGNITHLNLKALPEQLKFLFSDLFLRKLFYSLQAIGEIPRYNPKDKEKFRIFVIVDEAKLLVSKNQKTKAVLNKYASEIRKNGGGLILASQLISHFNNEILANIALKMCMKAEDKEQAKANNKYYGVGIDVLLNLDRGEAILIQGDYKERIKIIPSRER